MISEQKAQIKEFSGMNNEGGVFYVDGFTIENENGVHSMDESFTIKEISNPSESIKSKIYLYPLENSNLDSDTGYTLMYSGKTFYTEDSADSNIHSGSIGGVSESGDFKYTEQPDLFQLPSGNIFFTSSRHLGLLVRGLCHSDSTDSQIVDKEGRNFSDLGVSTSEPNNKVVNLNTGEEYTITSISTTNETDDTIEFDSGSESINTNDEFIVKVHTYKDLNDDPANGEIPIPTFAGQQRQEYWARPIQQWGNEYFVANGNYLAKIANDESTVDQMYKQLPEGHQIITFDINSVNFLVSTVDNKGIGHLLLWDGLSNGWNQILDLDSAPKAIAKSGGGWIFLMDGVVNYTDGANLDELVTWVEGNRRSAYNTTGFNAITSFNGIYYFCVEGSGDADRAIDGVLVFNPKTGLSLFKTKANGVGFKTPYCINSKQEASFTTTYKTNPILEVAGDGFYEQVQFYKSTTDDKDFKSFVYLMDFEQEMQIKEVWLNIKRGTKYSFKDREEKNATLSVNTGNNKTPILGYGKVNVTDTDTVENVNGDVYPGVEGQEIEFISGDVAGQRTFIKSISNAGTTDETWTIEPELSTTGDDCELRAWGLFKGDKRDITLSDTTKPVRFLVNHIGDKLWLEVQVRGTTDSFPVSINDIILF